MNLFEDESIIISQLLDKMGYGPTMIRLRKENCSNVTTYKEGQYALTCGSKGEGISKYLESDTDTMRVTTQIICTECVWNYLNCEVKIVFSMDTEKSNPGYTMLRLIFNRLVNVSPLVNYSLVQMHDGLFLSAYGWKQSWTIGLTLAMDELGSYTFEQIRGWSGPSIQSFHPVSCRPADNVYGIECECPSLLRAWVHRARPYSWPSLHLVKVVSETKAHVVPVGNTGSTYQHLEWRICFTEAELILIQHLKPCYTKALILLKAATKRTLKPICKEMSSYVVKNIILWIAEKDQCETAPETRLIAIFQQALKFLKTCIWKNNLPSYMIEQRNLFSGRLTRRSRLCARIDFLLKEGPRAVLRCGTVKHYLEMLFHSPELLQRKLVKVRAFEIFWIEGKKVDSKIFSSENVEKYDYKDVFRILKKNEDSILFIHKFGALLDSCITEELKGTRFLYELQSGVCNAETGVKFMRKNFPLLFGL